MRYWRLPEEKMMNLMLMEVVVRHDASAVPALAVFEHELPVLEHLYGAEHVEAGALAGRRDIGVEGEYARLVRKYGEESVVGVYGVAHSGRLEKAMQAAAEKSGKGKVPNASA
jgi:hypothetical protein